MTYNEYYNGISSEVADRLAKEICSSPIHIYRPTSEDIDELVEEIFSLPIHVGGLTKTFISIDAQEVISSAKGSILVLLYDLFNLKNYKNAIEFMRQQGDYTEYENGLILKSKNFIAIRYSDNIDDCYYINLTLGSKNRCTFDIDRSAINSINEYESKIDNLLFRIAVTGYLYYLIELAHQYIKWLYCRSNLTAPTILLRDNKSGSVEAFKRILYTNNIIREFLEKIMDEENISYTKLY